MGSIEEDTVYVAVGKNVDKTRQLLHWASQNFSAKKICILHVHQTLADINLPGYEAKDHAIKAFQEHGIQTVHELLDQYITTLVPAGVQAYKLLIEKDDIEKGIIEAIAQHNIRWLVMGAAADKYKLGCQFQTSVAVYFNALIFFLLKLLETCTVKLDML